MKQPVRENCTMTNSRITQCFAKLKAEKRTGLVTFTMAYDPDEKTSLEILKSLPLAGADIVELGVPFSDPTADGPIIQAAGKRALEAGASLRGTLKIAAAFRETHPEVPLVLMGYYNPVYQYGPAAFFKDAKAAGVDGLIIVDLPPEEDELIAELAVSAGIALIKLITPTTDDKRLARILPKASGFLYYVSVAGITGTKSATSSSVEEAIARFKRHTYLPVVVGFGIKTEAQVAEIGKVADAVVVGSALVQVIENQKKEAVTAASNFVSNLAKGTRR